MIWQCADCGNQVVKPSRPAACKFCGSDVEFFISDVKAVLATNKSAGHPGIWASNATAEPEAR